MTEEKQLDQNKRESRISILSRSLITGFIGGLIWSLFGVIMYYFNFSEVAPKSFLLRSWLTAEWTSGWLGDLVSIVFAGVLSLIAALIYYGLLKKVNSMWMGLVFGVILWGIIFYLLQPIFSNIPALVELNKNTIVSTICLFILYGTFVGYSISYDYHDAKLNKQKG